MKVSVVLCTYNGEKFVKRILECLLHQTLKPDEILVIDDCSKDLTMKHLLDFKRAHSEEGINIICNENNLGWKKNFLNGIFMAKGQYIFPCDQDDVWEPDKIEKMIAVLEEQKDALLVCCDYRIVYEDGAVKFPRRKISDVSNSGKIEKIRFINGILTVDRPGCTYCIAKPLIEIMKEMCFEGACHDALAWRAALSCDGLYVYHRKLIHFFRHSSNASDVKERKIESRLKVAKYYKTWIDSVIAFLENYNNVDNNAYKITYLDKCKKVQLCRIEYLSTGNILKAIQCINKICYYPSPRTYIADLLSILRWNELC